MEENKLLEPLIKPEAFKKYLTSFVPFEFSEPIKLNLDPIENKHIITLSARCQIDPYDFSSVDPTEIDKMVRKDLAEQIANILINEDLIRIDRVTSFMKDEYLAQIRVIQE